MDDETIEEVPVKKKRSDKRKRERPVFEGFPWEILNSSYSNLPNVWIEIVGSIENLSELKVVLYVMRHTWGFGEYDQFKLISIDEFMNGRKRRDGSRMDYGTRLTKQAVLNGLELAVEHGWLVCVVDDSDLGRVKKFYKLKMLPYEEGVNTIDPLVNTIDPQVNSLDGTSQYYRHRSKNELENQPIELTVLKVN
jgi:hypothetical protein